MKLPLPFVEKLVLRSQTQAVSIIVLVFISIPMILLESCEVSYIKWAQKHRWRIDAPVFWAILLVFQIRVPFFSKSHLYFEILFFWILRYRIKFFSSHNI